MIKSENYVEDRYAFFKGEHREILIFDIRVLHSS